MGVYRRPKCDHWYVLFYYDKKPVRWSSGTTLKREAQEYLADIKKSIRDGEFEKKYLYSPDHGSGNGQGLKTIGQVAAWYRENHAKAHYVPKSLKQFDYIIQNLLETIGDIPVMAMTRKHIEEYKTTRLAHVKKASVDKEIAMIGAMFNKLSQMDIIETNPIAGKIQFYNERSVRDRIASPDELKRIIDAMPRFDYFKVLFLLEYFTGLRAKDILLLRVQDLDLDRGLIPRLQPAKTRKSSGAVISVVLHDKIVPVLRQYIELNKITDRLFPVSYQGLRWRWMKVCEKAGVTGLKWHDLRHTYSTRLLNDSNASSKIIGDMMGINEDMVNKVYAQAEIQRKRDVINQIDTGPLDEHL